MPDLRFDRADVLRCVKHALESKERRSRSDDPADPAAGPALWLVKDTGIYVMSNGYPGDSIGKDSLFVAYATGYDPRGVDLGDLHDKCRRAVGGDDFAETIPLDANLVAALMTDGCDLTIRMTATQFSVGVLMPPGAPAKKRRRLS